LPQALERGALRVGVTENSPWVRRDSSGRPAGVEPQLIEDFAKEIGVDLRWQWGSAETHFEALERFELDLAIGGLTQSSPWTRRVGFTFPYYISPFHVGAPSGHSGSELSADLTGVTVAVHPESGLHRPLKDRGAKVVERENLGTSEGPVAAADWELEGLGLQPRGEALRKLRHGVAVPPGENALLVKLEDFLLRRARNGDLQERLWQEAQR
jgi:ABC-type amino acid transport substrate-binding protein